jgi:hypothetical protein
MKTYPGSKGELEIISTEGVILDGCFNDLLQKLVIAE